MNGLSFESEFHFERSRRGAAKILQTGTLPPSLQPGRVPKVSRLMALAIHLDDLVRSGAMTNYAEIARLGLVSRARVSQIMNLLNLAPDIQEALLFMPLTLRGRDQVILQDLQPIALTIGWKQQRLRWQQLMDSVSKK